MDQHERRIVDDLFDRLGVHTVLATEDGTPGTLGRVTAPLGHALNAVDPGADVRMYVCGPTPMLRAAAARGGSVEASLADDGQKIPF